MSNQSGKADLSYCGFSIDSEKPKGIMSALVAISTPRKGQDEDLRSYVEQAVPMFARAGGRVIKRLAVTEVLAGASEPGFVFVMDFDDVQTITTIFASAAYKALIPARDSGFEQMDIFVTEDM